MSRNFYEGRDADLFAGLASFSAAVTAEPGAMGLTAQQATALASLSAAALAAWAVSRNPATRTVGAVAQKDALRAEVRRMIGRYAAIMRATSTVTDQMLRDLGLHVPKRDRSPVPAPTQRPSLASVSVVGKTWTGRAVQRYPANVVGMKVYSFVGSDYPADPGAWTYEGDFTKRDFTITFPNSVPAGTQVWTTAAYYTRTGLTGPPSVPITTYVQYNGATTATPPMSMAA
jgi:hypothetical protein